MDRRWARALSKLDLVPFVARLSFVQDRYWQRIAKANDQLLKKEI